jgi:hypothetical protein
MKTVLIIFLFFTSAAHAQPCVPSSNSCDFYMCMEQQRQCGRDGYLVAFGNRYCRAFLQNETAFRPAAQNWLQTVRYELQKALLDIPDNFSCQHLEKAAFAHHPIVYEQTGFCEQPLSTKVQILSYFHRLFFDSRFINTAFAINQSCSLKN